MRARKEQLECRLEDFTDRGSHFEYSERSTKTRSGEFEHPKSRRKYNNKIFQLDGSERDPYLALKKYIQHRPPGVGHFYLVPIENPTGEIWYKKVALKKDGVAALMKRMAETAGIANDGHFGFSSGRKTAIQSLRSKYDPVTISELTGYANPASIMSYSHNPLNIQREMCQHLAGENKKEMVLQVTTST
jgi:hypothetical protein